MISCGEPSGDLYAGALAEALRRSNPAIEIFGFGGPRLEAAGATLVGDFSRISVTGLVEVLRVIPQSWAMLHRLVSAARERKPDVFVAIDFSGFNFRLMSRIRALGVPVVYYVSPQLWAWRAGRMAAMQAHVSRVLVIFPFEEKVYRDAGVPVEFVGHPLIDMTRAREPRDVFLRSLGLDPGRPVVAVLPGSRREELRRIAPTLAASLAPIRARVPGVQFIVACAPKLPDPLFAPLVEAGAALVRDRTDDVLASADIVITASGTATVQTALHGKPMVVVYRVSALTYRLGKPFLKLDTYAMPNLVAGRRIVPELIQDGFTPAHVADETVDLLTNAARAQQMKAALQEVRDQLGAGGASDRAARAVLEIAGLR
jgi:lipid-A-disaccharide synthase